MAKPNPNILITGTPGTGKSELCRLLREKLAPDFTLQNVSKIVVDNGFVEEYDADLECPVMDEDRLLDLLEPIMQRGGNIVEYHSSDFFPERWFAAVFVTCCSTNVLYDRLRQREYSERKLKSNMECEIFQTPLEEARDSYRKEIVFVLQNNDLAEQAANVQQICSWLEEWKNKSNKK
ncbi:adenylate kinase isoenzyme 6 homolog [Anopheles cruzii]|uniref:adenylate kinase isoenzyme 6 homolog n=1 Tax=Anopheles cruzii TaxID=68878 RepID=UPI0022EC1BD5|nr:adenylate kinase isoenzyme 6 homolog [Anopheles cruzii]